MICPHCLKEIADGNFNCPYCKKHIPSQKKGTGHATSGVFDEHSLKPRNYVSVEDRFMLRETEPSSSMEEEGYTPAQPSFETKFDRQNNE